MIESCPLGIMAAHNILSSLKEASRRQGVSAFHPLVLRRHRLATQWAASGSFTFDALLKKRKNAPLIAKRSPHPQFMYAEAGSPDRLEDGGIGSATEFVEMFTAEFLDAARAQDGRTPPYHYYTSMVDDFAPGLSEDG